MAQLNFGGVTENVMTREEFPLEKAREILKDETIAVIGYGVQGPGQACNLRDNGFNVIVGQRPGKTYEKAIADGWVPGETLFGIEEACEKGTIIMCLLSDAAVMSVWPTIKPYLTPGKALYFSHGFAITWNDRTGVVPQKDIDVIMVAPKGSGTSLRTMFLEGRGLNSSYAIYQDATGKAMDRTIALGIDIGCCILCSKNCNVVLFRHFKAFRHGLKPACENQCRAFIGQEVVKNNDPFFRREFLQIGRLHCAADIDAHRLIMVEKACQMKARTADIINGHIDLVKIR